MLGISLVIFLVMNVMPGDPLAILVDPKLGNLDPKAVELMRAKWGLDQPLYVQYLTFLKNALHGDLGYSYRFDQSVTWVVLERFPATIELALAAWIIATLLGTTAGVSAAVRHQTWFDTGSMLVALIGVSMPVFWLGLMLMYVLAVRLHLLPPSGYEGGDLRYLVMPALTLGLASAAVVARVTRSAMLNVIRNEYITTARSKGLSERVVIYRHALRNAMIPVTTIMGIQVGSLLSGAVVTETVFSWPGLGRLVIDSIMFRDLPVVQGCVLLFAVIFVLSNLVVDVFYAYLDPRIRY
ncbi:MAG: ABC transporter permease [Firmicutes bacterium]|nr:ABC transporter permease [Bacillota bacterium]MCL5040488.1 ABC transporter permease [Bacillota bacterium]